MHSFIHTNMTWINIDMQKISEGNFHYTSLLCSAFLSFSNLYWCDHYLEITLESTILNAVLTPSAGTSGSNAFLMYCLSGQVLEILMRIRCTDYLYKKWFGALKQRFLIRNPSLCKIRLSLFCWTNSAVMSRTKEYFVKIDKIFFILSWRWSLLCRNQSIVLVCESMNCFLYDKDLHRERVEVYCLQIFTEYFC